MQRFFILIATAITLTFIPFQIFAADLIETASNSGTSKIFLAAVKTAGLTETLKNSGPYTVFVPTDAAFEKLPAGALEALLKDKNRLAQVLTYHVIPGKVMIAEVKPGKVKTMQGNLLTLTSDNGKVTVNDANVIQSDMTADNGVIHEVDALVLPKAPQ